MNHCPWCLCYILLDPKPATHDDSVCGALSMANLARTHEKWVEKVRSCKNVHLSAPNACIALAGSSNFAVTNFLLTVKTR